MTEEGNGKLQAETAALAGCGRILFVDSYPGWRDLCHALAAKGLEIVAVSSAAEALQNVIDGPFVAALIAVDLQGPINGIALARRLKQLVPRLKIVMVAEEAQLKEIAGHVGGMIFMRKPSAIGDILEIVKTLGASS